MTTPSYSPLLDDVVTTTECARVYGITTATVRMALRAGRLTGRRVPTGGRVDVWLVLRADAERLWGYRRASP